MYCEETIEIRSAANDPELVYAHECMNDIMKANREAEREEDNGVQSGNDEEEGPKLNQISQNSFSTCLLL